MEQDLHDVAARSGIPPKHDLVRATG